MEDSDYRYPMGVNACMLLRLKHEFCFESLPFVPNNQIQLILVNYLLEVLTQAKRIIETMFSSNNLKIN